MEILQLDPHKIKSNPYQPRTRFDFEQLEELVASIRMHGILQPLVVTRHGGEYELIAGERRLRAALALNLPAVPVVVQDNIQKDEKLELALIENIQRQDLNPIERARGFKRLMEEFGFTHDVIAERLGMPRSSISNTMRLLGLPEEIQKSIAEGMISEGHGKVLAAITDPERQKELAARIVGQTLSVRGLEKIVKQGVAAQAPVSDPNLQEKIEALEQKLSARVHVSIGKNKRGKIVIKFWSPEELSEIVTNLVG